jgi:hypothetical protein
VVVSILEGNMGIRQREVTFVKERVAENTQQLARFASFLLTFLCSPANLNTSSNQTTVVSLPASSPNGQTRASRTSGNCMRSLVLFAWFYVSAFDVSVCLL